MRLIAKVALLCLLLNSCGMKESANQPTLPNIDTLWNFSNVQETEKKFRELIPLAAQQEDRAYHIELLTQLARTQGLQQKFDEANEILDSANAMITQEMVVPSIRYYLEKGRVFNSSGNREEATKQFTLSFNLAQENAEDYYAVDAAHMLGISANAEDQLNWSLKALEIAEQSKNEKTKKWLGPLYNNIGWTYHDLGQLENALNLFEKSLEWNEQYGSKRSIFIAKWTIGSVYRSLNRVEDALEVQQNLLVEVENGWSETNVGYVYEELAECLLAICKVEESKPHFSKAYSLLSEDQWLRTNEEKRIERLREMSL